MLELNLQETNQIFLGERVTITLKEHGSVGIKSKAITNDESIISYVTSNFEYSNATIPMQPGGDGGHRTYVFKANKSGNTTITTQRIFRGRLEHEHNIDIIVTA
ncbi:protease inhibitor I42 family protein [Cocleimonas flava]|uniref:Proteinase inhibitor I42 chagasin domain-containing protein n=1 Tax=Cocleimonas flava TaxID=634765 RepID=A0A4R1F0I0_9GAMM|nr:hypothetical protein EV695_1791 [Cocleimonas flava]